MTWQVNVKPLQQSDGTTGYVGWFDFWKEGNQKRNTWSTAIKNPRKWARDTPIEAHDAVFPQLEKRYIQYHPAGTILRNRHDELANDFEADLFAPSTASERAESEPVPAKEEAHDVAEEPIKPLQPPTGTPQDADTDSTQNNATQQETALQQEPAIKAERKIAPIETNQQDAPTVKLLETPTHHWNWSVNVMGIVRDGTSATRIEGLIAGYKKAVELVELWQPDRLEAVKAERNSAIEAEQNSPAHSPSHVSSTIENAPPSPPQSVDEKQTTQNAATSQQSDTTTAPKPKKKSRAKKSRTIKDDISEQPLPKKTGDWQTDYINLRNWVDWHAKSLTDSETRLLDYLLYLHKVNKGREFLVRLASLAYYNHWLTTPTAGEQKAGRTLKQLEDKGIITKCPTKKRNDDTGRNVGTDLFVKILL